MSEPPLKPVLQKPPGYRDPNLPAAAQSGFRPPPRKPVLPPSFNPRRRNRSFCRVCCCWLCIFVLVLVLLAVIGGLVFYIWFDPKFPVFHIRSFRITRFNVTERPDGTYLDATTTTGLEMKNPNVKITYYYGKTEVGVSVGEGGDETPVGTTAVPGFTMWKQSTMSLKVETKVSNTLVDDWVGKRLRSRYRNKILAVKVEARTKVGVSVTGLKVGKVAVTVKCDGITMKELDGGDMPKCVIDMLKW
ncbi:hypothetical protein E1A91_D12G128200v1 [Gossypium mustelinum]|uniref:Uncharacterized protein n=1 Tax=Gossypium mustelinum TaxID=34275 RepID=A0A5D2SDR4_GOSMU|nr:hypothetical protein E1A91_D12G128200v1 [Gossypium mustelinum]